MNLDTQEIHKFHIADTPGGPLELTYNLESRWFSVTLPGQISLEYLDSLLIALGIIHNHFDKAIKDSATIRSDVEADWEQLNRLVRKGK